MEAAAHAQCVAAGDTESKSFRLYFHYFRNNARAVMEASAFHTKLKSYEMSLAAGKENEMDDAEFEAEASRSSPTKRPFWPHRRTLGFSSSFQIFMRARGTRFVATVAATTLKPRIASSSPTLTGESPESGR